jgi:TRAP-type mannitol/chloroaromatic compound transport system permease small subunit
MLKIRFFTQDSLLFIVAFFPGMAFFFCIGVQEFIHAWETLERSDVTPWGASLVPFKASIPVAALLLLIQGVPELLKSLYAVVKNEQMTV